MTSVGRIRVVRLLALAALTVSTALLANEVGPNPHLCGYESDCEAVLSSAFAHPLGVPLPLAGVAAFAALLGMSLFPESPVGRLLGPATLAAGVCGIFLLLIQGLVLRRLCPFCALVDAAAVSMAVVQLACGHAAGPAPGVPFRTLWVAAAAAGLALGLALGVAGGRAGDASRPPPPEVTALWVPGKLNVVEVADFACPHCRRMHAVLTRFLAEEGDRVHFVRLTAPMPAHPGARHASRAFLCAGEQGKGDAMAEALFLAPALDPDCCERMAASLRLSMPAFRACTLTPGTDARLDAGLAWVRAASPQGLPVVWIQDHMVFGLQPIEALRAAARSCQPPPPVGERDEARPGP
jgi:uncharacterized membrane protein